MGWIHGSETGRGGRHTCRHGNEVGFCAICAADSMAEAARLATRYSEAKAERLAALAARSITLAQSGVTEIEDYEDYERGLMKWVPVEEFLAEAPKAFLADGLVYAHPEGVGLACRFRV